MIEAIWTQRKERGTTRGSRPFDYGLIRVKGAGAGTCDLFFHKGNIAAGGGERSTQARDEGAVQDIEERPQACAKGMRPA